MFKTHRLDANYTLGQRFGIHTPMSEIPIGAGVNYFCVASSSFAIVIILSFCAFKNTNTSGDENATDRRMLRRARALCVAHLKGLSHHGALVSNRILTECTNSFHAREIPSINQSAPPTHLFLLLLLLLLAFE